MCFTAVVRRERSYKVQLRGEILGPCEIILLSTALRFVRRVFERVRLYGVDERFNCDAEWKKKGGKWGHREENRQLLV